MDTRRIMQDMHINEVFTYRLRTDEIDKFNQPVTIRIQVIRVPNGWVHTTMYDVPTSVFIPDNSDMMSVSKRIARAAIS